MLNAPTAAKPPMTTQHLGSHLRLRPDAQDIDPIERGSQVGLIQGTSQRLDLVTSLRQQLCCHRMDVLEQQSPGHVENFPHERASSTTLRDQCRRYYGEDLNSRQDKSPRSECPLTQLSRDDSTKTDQPMNTVEAARYLRPETHCCEA